MLNALKINENDNVAVALGFAEKGSSVNVRGEWIALLDDIGQGHKFALKDIPQGGDVIKYGQKIGTASEDILTGQWVHTHNLKTGLGEISEYEYGPVPSGLEPRPPEYFEGFLRADGRVGVRNEVWIIPTVGCVNGIARLLESAAAELVVGECGGIYAFPHPFGCSQLGEDLLDTQKILAGLVNHPNAGGVLVLGLGCENNNIAEFKKVLGPYDERRVKFMTCQEHSDEMAEGLRLIRELAERASGLRRERQPISKLTVGLKCGGSDGFSGITANPVAGIFSDRLTARGGSVILTEVPEMFGAETLLMNRCANSEVFGKTVDMINDFKEYFRSNGQEIYENPSPGNKDGGITTLEEKSLGCVQKSGSGPVMGVAGYGNRVTGAGLHLLNAPGNDLVASTALAAAGAQIILFTTGRGTPFACAVPTVKISTNRRLAEFKKLWIDFDAGGVAEGEDIEAVADGLFDYVLKLTGGAVTAKSESHGLREIAFFKRGVIL